MMMMMTQQQQQQQQFRLYTPMTKEEEEQEKARVSHLTPHEKDSELRQLNREIARLETLKGINTGEKYTWTGQYKALVRHVSNPRL
jgi:transcription initiation factor TFIID subunit TAF12